MNYFQVGSGKSSLINSILGEMRVTQGNISTCGSISYVPQVFYFFICFTIIIVIIIIYLFIYFVVVLLHCCCCWSIIL